MNLAELKKELFDAFRDVEYPGDDKIAIKEWYLRDELLEGYIGLKKEQVTIDFINNGHRDSTSFMTDVAFCYYLPAFLSICAEASDKTDIFPEYVIRKLMPPSESDYKGLLLFLKEEGIPIEDVGWFPGKLENEQNAFCSFIKMLSIEQREAIYNFLVFYEHKYHNRMGTVALMRFWNLFKKCNFVEYWEKRK